MPSNWITVNVAPESSSSSAEGKRMPEPGDENLIRNRLLKKLLEEETKKTEVFEAVLAGVEASRGPYPIEPLEFRRIDIPSIPRHVTEETLERYFESIGHKLDDCTIEYRHNVNGMYRVVYVCLSSMDEVDEVMRTRPHYIGEFQLQLRRYTMPGTEKRMAKRVAVEMKKGERIIDEALLSYMAHFGEVVKIEPLDRADGEQFTNLEALGGRLVEFSDGDAADKLVLCSPHYLFADEFQVRKLVEARKREDPVAELIKHTEQRLDRKRIKQKRSAEANDKRDQKRIAAVVEAYRPRNPLDGLFSQPDAYRTQKDDGGNAPMQPHFAACWQARPLMDLSVAPHPPPIHMPPPSWSSLPAALPSFNKLKPAAATRKADVSSATQAATYTALPASIAQPITTTQDKVSSPQTKRVFISIPRK